MKKLMAVCIMVVVFGSTAFAQFSQGRMLLGGAFGATFNTEKAKSGNSTTTLSTDNSISLTPQFGYFIIDNFAIGAGLTLASEKIKDKQDDYKNSETTVAFSPFARYYVQKFFGQATVSIGSDHQTASYPGVPDSKSTSSLFGWGLSVGYAAFLNDYIAIEPQIGYAQNSLKASGSSDKSIDGGLFLKVGFQIYFGK